METIEPTAFEGSLDEEFAQKMKEASLEHLKLIPSSSNRKRLAFLIDWMNKIVNISPFQDESFHISRTHQVHRVPKIPTRAYIAFVIYFYVLGKTLINSTYQYRYDFAKSQYDTLSQNHSQADNMTMLRLAEEVEKNRGMLKYLGSPFINMHFMVETAYIQFIIIFIIVHVEAQIYFRYISPFNCSLIRLIFNIKREQLNYSNLIIVELNRFIESSANFVLRFKRIRETRRFRDDSHYWQQMQSQLELDQIGMSRMVFAPNHQSSVQLIKQMALNGLFQPINHKPAWLERIYTLYLRVLYSVVIIAILFVFVFLMYILPKMADAGDIELKSNDLIYLIEILFGIIAIICCLVFYAALSLINIIDHLRTIRELEKKIKTCINQSNLIFRQNQYLALANCCRHSPVSSQSTGSSLSKNYYEQYLHISLLYIYIQHRIFVRQVRALNSCLVIITFGILQFLVLGPIVYFIHTPYIPVEIARLLLSCAAVPTIMCDLCLIPICYMYRRCTDLYKLRFSFIAHAVEIKRQLGDGYHVYDRHLIWLLGKELESPHQLIEQFAVKIFGMIINYANILKIHYWCALSCLFSLLSAGQQRTDSILIFL